MAILLSTLVFLRTVPTIVVTFCASRVSVMLTKTGIFLRGYTGKVDLSNYSWYSKRKLGVAMHSIEII